MLDYEECKKVFSDKLQNDLLGKGRIEAAFFAAVKFAYQSGHDDGWRSSLESLIFGFGDGSIPVWQIRKILAAEQVSHDNQSR